MPLCRALCRMGHQPGAGLGVGRGRGGGGAVCGGGGLARLAEAALLVGEGILGCLFAALSVEWAINQGLVEGMGGGGEGEGVAEGET